MWPKNILVLLIALNFASARNRLLTPLVPSEDYAFHLSIDSSRPDFLNMYWKMVNDEIQIEIHCQTTGYVAFGLSPDGKMPKSDIVIGWVDSSGSYLFVRLMFYFKVKELIENLRTLLLHLNLRQKKILNKIGHFWRQEKLMDSQC